MRSALLVPLLLLAVPAAVSAQGKVTKEPVKSVQPAKAVRYRFVVAPAGNEARYRVREQLAGFDLPNDAIGVTKEITGRLVVESDGRVVPDSSTITVQLANLKSDKTRRDLFLQRNTLETAKFPTVMLVPVALQGQLSPLTAGASTTFSLLGNLTIHGVMHPTTWHVTARAEGKDIVGTAVTAFTFKDAGLVQPRVPVVLSVADTIKLEYDFHFVPDTTR